MHPLRWLDMPPLWLLLFCALAWVQAARLPFGTFGGAWADLAGGLLIGAGVVLTVLALAEFKRHRTTPIPHRQASALVASGVFARSRNPIYLGDAAILAGVILWRDAVPALILIPLFVWLVTDRFIGPEEVRLRAAFGPAFDAYAARVRRWL